MSTATTGPPTSEATVPGVADVPPAPDAHRRGRGWRRRGGPADRVGLPLLSAALFLALWQLVSWWVTADVLPGPVAALGAMRTALGEGQTWSDMGDTAQRIAGAFALSLVAAVVIGVGLGSSRVLARLFGSWVTILASIPSLLIVVVVYLAVGIDDRGAIVAAALVVTPSITFNVWQGMRSLDPDLSEMARAFGVPRRVALRRVLLPQTLPFLFAAARSGLALVWKIIIFVELLGRSSGVGYRIQFWYSLFNMERVLGVALPFILIMLGIEFVVLRPLEARLFRWRREESR
jgi:NitT/TauT family transport system permease protein